MLPKLPPLPQTSLPADLALAVSLAAELEAVVRIAQRHVLTAPDLAADLAPVTVRVAVLMNQLAYRLNLAAKCGAEVGHRIVHGPGRTM